MKLYNTAVAGDDFKNISFSIDVYSSLNIDVNLNYTSLGGW